MFPQKSSTALQNALSTFDLTYFPKDRGPYNFDATNITADGHLQNPAGVGRHHAADRVQRFEASNVEYIEFWVMDPYIHRTSPSAMAGGSMYINLGNVSEDVLKDSRKFFENGIPYPKDTTQLDRTVWGFVPRFDQQLTRTFDNDPAARAVQDVGFDGLDDNEESTFFYQYLSEMHTRFPQAYAAAAADPASDNYKYYRDGYFDQNNSNILDRYKYYNNPQGNSPVADASASYSSASTTIPESEDIDRDNTMNELESYYQYRVDLHPGMVVGENFIVNKQVTQNIKMPDGSSDDETWYQFKIPITQFPDEGGRHRRLPLHPVHPHVPERLPGQCYDAFCRA